MVTRHGVACSAFGVAGRVYSFDMVMHCDSDELIAHLRSQFSGRLVAIDGLPVAGKTTLAERLVAELGWSMLSIDEFLLPHEDWPKTIAPAFPFPYFRTEEFRAAVRDLRRSGRASYEAYDWTEERLVNVVCEPGEGPVCIEGCSVLDPAICDQYDLSIFVDSDERTVRSAQQARDGEVNRAHWPTLFFPSVDLYMRSNPQSRASFRVRGRGVR